MALPLASRGVFLGAVLAWARAAGEFGAVIFVGGPGAVDFVEKSRSVSILLKRVVKAAAKKNGLAASFMAKPFAEHAGCGLHVHVSLVDEDGNIVSLTQSINHFFGSGIVPEGTGFLLNNHMDDFSMDPHSPNAPGPHRRPVSNMGPLILFRSGRPFLVLGSPGGTRIVPSLTQILFNVTRFGMSLDEAIEAPRFFSYSTGGRAGDLHLEDRIPEATRAALERLGHNLVVREAYDKYFGGAQGLMLLQDEGLILGGADSRRDGSGAGY